MPLDPASPQPLSQYPARGAFARDAASALGGWWGKEFYEDGSGINLVRRQGELQGIFPIRVSATDSLLDGKPCLQVRYLP